VLDSKLSFLGFKQKCRSQQKTKDYYILFHKFEKLLSFTLNIVSKIYLFLFFCLPGAVFFDVSAVNSGLNKQKYDQWQGPDSIPELERVFIRYGLVNVILVDSTLKVDLRYAVADNFTGKVLYSGLKNAYLQQETAEKLAMAQKHLKSMFPHYTLVILDAARPVSVQEMMWNNAGISAADKSRFLASPSVGSLHSYGAAVDVTIADGNGKYLDMGTPFDAFDELSYAIYEKAFADEGKLTFQQLANRNLLRMVMKKAGFATIDTEWWHFNACSRTQARTKYPIVMSHVYSKNNFPEKDLKVHADKIRQKSDIVFRVQVKTSTRPMAAADTIFKGQQITRYKHEGLYKYTAGEFRNLEDAREFKNKMKAMGFTDAFVAAFNHNKRIGIMDAVELMNESK
jgi:D-alanyl-D-alanine dipeptidase